MGTVPLIAWLWGLPTSVLAWGMIAAGLATFVTLMVGVTAPYGRRVVVLLEGWLSWC